MEQNTRVPKIIHLMWFSGEEFPKDIKTCLDTWKKILPDYEIRLWTKDMALNTGYPYVKEAIECKKWAFAADVVRLYALYTYGGVYMDSDVIVKKSLDVFLDNKLTLFQECHKGMVGKMPKGILDSNGIRLGEKMPSGIGIQAAFMIAQKGNQIIGDMLAYYNGKHFIKEDGTMATDLIAPTIFALQLEKYGYRYIDEEQMLAEGMKVLPSCYVAPGKSELDKRNYAIHCINHSWQADSLKFRFMQLIKNPIRRLLGFDVHSLAKK